MFRIAHGRVYDPQHGIDGEIRDVWIQEGKVIAPPAVAATGINICPRL